MKTLFAILLSLVTVSAVAAGPMLAGQPSSSHSANLTWTASPDGGTVNVYRASGACATGIAFTKIQSGVVSAGPYSDSTIGVGSWCYQVTAVVSGAESLPSNQITLSVLPSPPSGLAGSAN